jgi:hypothetical protein
VARNQEIDIPSQLAMGVRLLQAQSHMLVRYLFHVSIYANLRISMQVGRRGSLLPYQYVTAPEMLLFSYGRVFCTMTGCVCYDHTCCPTPNLHFIQLLFDGGTVSDYLSKVKTFLDANPNEGVRFFYSSGTL